MDSVSFKLDVYEGPLDLLLHLISKNELSITDIPIMLITEQYFETINSWHEMDIDFSSEFLIMAAELLYIKSKYLLPIHQDEQEEDDPKELLERRLLEYKKYKEISEILKTAQAVACQTIYKAPENLGFSPTHEEMNANVSANKLLKAFLNILDREDEKKPPTKEEFDEVVRKPVSILLTAKKIRSFIKCKGQVLFEDLFSEISTRPEKVATFLAILELVKRNRILIHEKNDMIYLSEGKNE